MNNYNIQQYKLQNRKNAFNIISFGLFILFILNPFVSSILALFSLYYRVNIKSSYFIIVLFCGLFGYTFLPHYTMDITRHYIAFDLFKDVDSFSDFILLESTNEKPDFALDFLYWIIGKYVKKHQIVGFLGAVIYYGLGLSILLRWRKQLLIKSSLCNFLIPFLMFCALAQVTEFNGMRQGNAILLFLFIITIPNETISLYKKYFLLLLPCVLHFSMYPIVLLYIFASYLSYRYILIITFFLLISFPVFTPFMVFLKHFLLLFGSIGMGISDKIDAYLFEGDIEAGLYSGSVIRFIVILIMMFIYPFVTVAINKKRKAFPTHILYIYYWGMLFFAYMIFTSSSFILSRNIMMFKMFSIIYFSYILFSINLNRVVRSILFLICVIVIVSGPFSLFLSYEYKVVNPKLFFYNVFDLLSIETSPIGYNY